MLLIAVKQKIWIEVSLVVLQIRKLYAFNEQVQLRQVDVQNCLCRYVFVYLLFINIFFFDLVICKSMSTIKSGLQGVYSSSSFQIFWTIIQLLTNNYSYMFSCHPGSLKKNGMENYIKKRITIDKQSSCESRYLDLSERELIESLIALNVNVMSVLSLFCKQQYL